MASAKTVQCFFYSLICFLSIASACKPNGQEKNVSLTFLSTAKGAMCLDGSPAAYFFDKGEGDGVDNWLIFIEGGGWCSTAEDCKYRAGTGLGSSKYLGSNMPFGHIISQNDNGNPEFCNWNRIHVHYCDGSSFTGDVEEINSTTNVAYRGARIFHGIMDDLISKGMGNAKNAILSGSSAGGLAAIIHCDRFRSFLPATARVKCLSDSGYFLHEKLLTGDKIFDTVFEGLIDLQGSCPMLPSSCIAKWFKPSLCFFPQYILQDVTTPLFLVMSSFDQIQIEYNLSPMHEICIKNKNCTSFEMSSIQAMRLELIHSLPISDPSFRGMWVTSCFTHEVTIYSWIAPKLMVVANNKTYPQIFADWFYDRTAIQVIDSSAEVKNCTMFGIHIKSEM